MTQEQKLEFQRAQRLALEIKHLTLELQTIQNNLKQNGIETTLDSVYGLRII